MHIISGASLKTGAYFGSGSGPIHLDYVVCSGTEYNLTDCQTGNRTRQSNHSEDVGVKCQTSKYRVCTHNFLSIPLLVDMIYVTVDPELIMFNFT